MKIILAGGSGFLGRSLINNFSVTADWVVLARDKNCHIPNAKVVFWDGQEQGTWSAEIDGSDIVINLSGKSVNCRYNKRNKAAIFASRLDSTSAIQTAIENATNKPKVWINAASATIYRHSELDPMTEAEGEIGTGFSVEVCKAWEALFFAKEIPGVRKVAIRTAIALGKKGGVLGYFANLVRCGIGGKMGNGLQMFSWIHEKDFARAILFLIQHESGQGVFNVASPNPIPNKEFMGLLQKQLHMPIAIPTPKWLLEMGAVFIGTETELILKSRYVVPAKLLSLGFNFSYPEMKNALKELIV